MHNALTVFSRYFAFLLAAAVLFFMASFTVAYAQIDESDSAEPAAASSQLSVAANGQVIVRDAVVVAIDGWKITVQLSWGETELLWDVRTTGSTRFVPSGGSQAVLEAIRRGDRVNFSGKLDTTAARPTVHASVLKDTSLIERDITKTGTVTALDPAARQLMLESEAGEITVRVNGSTTLAAGSSPISLDDLSVGQEVSVSGTMNLVTKALVADRIELPETAAAVPDGGDRGLFVGILTWLRGSGGLFTGR